MPQSFKESTVWPATWNLRIAPGPRYLATLEVKAEWDEPTGTHIIAEGTTENVGPEGTLVHLPRQLPDVGSTVRLEILGESGERLQVIAEVLRIERNPGHPLAALQLVGETEEWKGLVWEPAAPRARSAAASRGW